MIEAQIISKILQEGNIDHLLSENITSDYFTTYNEEIKFIFNHYNEYKATPTNETFLGKFSDFELTSTNEDWAYLITGIREGYMFNQLATLFNSSANVIQENALTGYQMLKNKIFELENVKPMSSNDIVKNASQRLKTFNDKLGTDDKGMIPIGLKEMDEKIDGWLMGEELVTITARTNQGKSWILIEFLMNAWKQGKRVGLYSGEMSADQIGYRFDALNEHFSNLDLTRANEEVKEKYEAYIKALESKENCFVIITPKDLGHYATINDIDYMIKKYDLDMVGIDQLSLMSDFRSNKNDPLRIRLSNITNDLFNLSMKYKIPVLALSQANRASAKNGTPDLENLAESDAIGQNSSKVIGMARVGNELKLTVVKNRYGPVGDEFIYLWDIDKGEFRFSKYGTEKSEVKTEDASLSRRPSEEESPF